MAQITATTPWTYAAPAITGTTYYVSPSGSDVNSGTSPSQAWRTVHQATKASVTMKPGDAILFQGGASFNDSVLMPGWGGPLSGTATAPIVLGSYGSGKASLPQGVYLHSASHLVIENLDMGPAQGVTGTGDHITIQGCSIHDILPGQVPSGWDEEAINVVGSGWVIRGNLINRTGDSGMLIRGDNFWISGNVIANTGQDKSVTYGAHGIYLKATKSAVNHNTIYNFMDDGISIRYRDSVVTDNVIAAGSIGLGWFQYDTIAGTSHWTNNTIVGARLTAVYVSGWDPTGGNTRESFVISGNKIQAPSPVSSAFAPMNLKPTSGTYSVSGNEIG